MQFPLRMLILATAVVPPVAALLWMALQGSRIDPVLPCAVMYGLTGAALLWLWK